MSDEEEDEGVFTRHIPTWRSDILSDYVKELDIRWTANKSEEEQLELMVLQAKGQHQTRKSCFLT